MEDVGISISESLQETLGVISTFVEDKNIVDCLARIVKICFDSLDTGGKILLAGNGGSAADAQHIAGELVSRFKFHREGLPAIALTTDTSILTAIGNDYGFEQIFARQIRAIGNSGDIFIAYSTSGASKNILEGLAVCKTLGIISVGLTGLNENTDDMSSVCDYLLRVPSFSTPKIQEGHLIAGHVICEELEKLMFPVEYEKTRK